MTQVNMHEAKTHLSSLVERAIAGEDIYLARAGKRRAKIVPAVEEPEKRIFGFAKGEFELPKAFFEPWTEEEIDLWYK
jgi:antitoxin (DNA-binding transcriptional repressor) of toxin-antitoxin stability system